jgi:hypothetical protein
MVKCTCTVEIKTPTQWNLIGRSMTAPAACVIAPQYSSSTFVSLRSHSRKQNIGELSINFNIIF